MARVLLEKPPLAKSAAVVQMAGALLAALFSFGPALLWLVSCSAQRHLAAGYWLLALLYPLLLLPVTSNP